MFAQEGITLAVIAVAISLSILLVAQALLQSLFKDAVRKIRNNDD
jgi:hypothetical protein